MRSKTFLQGALGCLFGIAFIGELALAVYTGNSYLDHNIPEFCRLREYLSRATLIVDGVIVVDKTTLESNSNGEISHIGGHIDVKEVLYSRLKSSPSQIRFRRDLQEREGEDPQGDLGFRFWNTTSIGFMENARVIGFVEGENGEVKTISVFHYSSPKEAHWNPDGKHIREDLLGAIRLVKENAFHPSALNQYVSDFTARPVLGIVLIQDLQEVTDSELAISILTKGFGQSRDSLRQLAFDNAVAALSKKGDNFSKSAKLQILKFLLGTMERTTDKLELYGYCMKLENGGRAKMIPDGSPETSAIVGKMLSLKPTNPYEGHPIFGKMKGLQKEK